MQQKWNQNFDGEPMADIPQKFLNAGCDVYMVMQLRHDEKILDERFASMRELNHRGKTPDPEHYEVTYYADLPAMWQDVPNNEVLEELFQNFKVDDNPIIIYPWRATQKRLPAIFMLKNGRRPKCQAKPKNTLPLPSARQTA